VADGRRGSSGAVDADGYVTDYAFCGHCKSCRWWLLPLAGDPSDPDGLCQRWVYRRGAMVTLEAWTLGKAGSRVGVLDECKRLWTHPSYGCVQWEGMGAIRVH